MYNKQKDPTRCQASVHNPGTTVTFHQCTRKPKKDGWCAIHHPDAEEERQKKSEAKYEERRSKDPLMLAWRKIEELEKENKRLKKQLSKVLTIMTTNHVDKSMIVFGQAAVHNSEELTSFLGKHDLQNEYEEESEETED